jgi:hypothetical protein
VAKIEKIMFGYKDTAHELGHAHIVGEASDDTSQNCLSRTPRVQQRHVRSSIRALIGADSRDVSGRLAAIGGAQVPAFCGPITLADVPSTGTALTFDSDS